MFSIWTGLNFVVWKRVMQFIVGYFYAALLLIKHISTLIQVDHDCRQHHKYVFDDVHFFLKLDNIDRTGYNASYHIFLFFPIMIPKISYRVVKRRYCLVKSMKEEAPFLW